MKKAVYVVMKGEYSDKSVVAIFSTEEKMNNFLSNARSDEYSQTYWSGGSFTLDELITDNNLIPFRVAIDGCLSDSEISTPDSLEYSENNVVNFNDCFCDVVIYCMANDANHALKIASERYMQMKALNWFDIYKGKTIEYYTQKEI